MLSAPDSAIPDDGDHDLVATGRTTTGTFAVIDALADGGGVGPTAIGGIRDHRAGDDRGLARKSHSNLNGSAETCRQPKLPEGLVNGKEKLDSQGARVLVVGHLALAVARGQRRDFKVCGAHP